MSATMKKKLDEANEKACRAEILDSICDLIEQQMNWDCMNPTDDYDEEGHRIYESYAKKYQDIKPDSYEGRMIKKEKIWNEVLKAIEKLADK